MEGFAYKFIQNRINELKNQEENLKVYLEENTNQFTMDMRSDIKEKIYNLRNERIKLNKALEYELGVR